MLSVCGFDVQNSRAKENGIRLSAVRISGDGLLIEFAGRRCPASRSAAAATARKRRMNEEEIGGSGAGGKTCPFERNTSQAPGGAAVRDARVAGG